MNVYTNRITIYAGNRCTERLPDLCGTATVADITRSGYGNSRPTDATDRSFVARGTDTRRGHVTFTRSARRDATR